ncbi:hypothetical protein RU08_22990 [Pseudomonas fulva]|uniref:Uncharacterized protein n=1 Tax=Pseudomonas fulva TaxID=47880 RepID=A0A0D0J5I6_9PSED|nr:hypothetical protein RU08_22990 [Pseudomonas fulva]
MATLPQVSRRFASRGRRRVDDAFFIHQAIAAPVDGRGVIHPTELWERAMPANRAHGDAPTGKEAIGEAWAP